jgi:hypothetical protein
VGPFVNPMCCVSEHDPMFITCKVSNHVIHACRQVYRAAEGGGCFFFLFENGEEFCLIVIQCLDYEGEWA